MIIVEWKGRLRYYNFYSEDGKLQPYYVVICTETP